MREGEKKTKKDRDKSSLIRTDSKAIEQKEAPTTFVEFCTCSGDCGDCDGAGGGPGGELELETIAA